MQKEIQNKKMSGSEKTVQTKQTVQENSYHFSGEGRHRPVVIKAQTMQEATKKYEEQTKNNS